MGCHRIRENAMPTPIDRHEVGRLAQRGAQLVEVLPREEYEEQHLPGAVNVPVGRIERAHETLDTGRPVVVYCWDGA